MLLRYIVSSGIHLYVIIVGAVVPVVLVVHDIVLLTDTRPAVRYILYYMIHGCAVYISLVSICSMLYNAVDIHTAGDNKYIH